MEAEAAALGGLGDAQYVRGRMAAANEQFLKCVALSRTHSFGRLEVANLPMVGWTLLHLNEMRRAVEVGHEAIELAVRAAQPRAEMLARVMVVWVEGLIRGNADAAATQLERALPLSRALGAKRFEAQLLGYSAMASLRRGDRGAARVDAETALGICREHGMGHIGPWILGILARLEADPPARMLALAEAEAELQRGCVSHNHIFVRELGIDTALVARDWASTHAQCASLEAYTAGQPLPFSDFLIARGRALANWGRGQREPALCDELARLRDVGAACELNVASQALVEALATQAVPPPSST